MEEILYVKIAQNIPVAKRQVTFHDLATLHCTNKKVVQELNQMVFYTPLMARKKRCSRLRKYMR